jgi:hypothetical protein
VENRIGLKVMEVEAAARGTAGLLSWIEVSVEKPNQIVVRDSSLTLVK